MRPPLRGKAVLAAFLLAGATALGAAPLGLNPEPQQETAVDSNAADAALAPVHAEQNAELEARAHAERSGTMLRYDFDSRGPTWMHNGGQVNPADHPTRLERNESLQEYLRSIEAVGQRDRSVRATAPGRQHVDAAAETVLTMDSGAAAREPRGLLQWASPGWLAAAVVLLLMGWFGAKLLQRRPRRLHRHRHRRPEAAATPAPAHRHRRRRHRSHRDPSDGTGRSA